MLSWGGLRFRLVLLVLLALLPVFGLFAYSAVKDRQAAVVLAQSSLQSGALLAAAHQQRLVERVARLLDDIASGQPVGNTQNQACVKYLKSLQARDSGYANLGVIGMDGKISCQAQDSGAAIYAGDQQVFRQVLAGRKFSVGEYREGEASKRSGISFGAPVVGDAGALNGVAFATVSIAAVADTLAVSRIPDGAQLRVTDRNGIIVAAQPAGEGLQGTREPDAVVLAAAQARQPGAREAADATGVARVYAYAPVGGAANGSLFVAVSVPRQIIMAASREAMLVDLATLLGAGLVGMAGAWWLGKRLIVNPANEILKEANEVTRGNLSARVKPGSPYQGELGQIGLSFNRMAESLEARQVELSDVLHRAEKERALLDMILNSMSDGVIAVDTEGRFLLRNATARQLFSAAGTGASTADWYRANEMLALDGKTVYPWSARPLAQALHGLSIDNWELVFRRPGEQDRILKVNTRPLRDEGGRLIGGVTVFGDITERKAAETFALAQEQVLTLIAGGAPLRQSLEAIVRLIENSSPGSLCSILLLEGRQLRHGAAPSLPDGYNQAIDGQQIGDGVGACGTAAFRKERVVVEDVERDPLMQGYRDLLLGHELRSCWSAPVLATSGEVLATFAIYRRKPHQPQPREMELVETAIRLARIAIERMRAEEALVGSRARFRELAENIEDIFYNRDFASGRFLYISPAYEFLWCDSRERLYADSQAYLERIHPDDRAVEAAAKVQQAHGLTTDQEYRIVRPDGAIRWIRDHSYPVLNEAGKVERIVGTARDITERKLSDLELTRTNRALQMLSRTSMAINRTDDEALLLPEVCRVAVEVGGYRMAWVGYAQDDEARSIQPMAHAGDERGYLDSIELSWRDDHPTSQGPAGQAVRGGQPMQIGDINRSADFYWRDAALQRGYRSVIGLPLRDGQRTFGVLCLYAGERERFASDEVSLLQELADNLAFGIGSLRARLAGNQARDEVLRLNASLEERVRQRTAQLEFANKQMESFSYSVSHDLRSPLNAIDGFSSLLQKTVVKMESGPLSERSAHYLARIRAGVSQMGELIEGMLSLSLVSRASLLWEPVDLSALAASLLDHYREREPDRAALLQVEAGLLAQGDSRLLKQVLDNLLGNAWKFSAGQIRIEITVGHETSSTGETVYFVRDNGAGFNMAYADKLFGTFQRLHTQNEFAGTGIGLATVQRIIQRHGGKIWGESAPGSGATFYFTLGTAML